MNIEKSNISKISELLISHKIGILPTDTIYGIHCLANIPVLEDEVYKLKKRSKETRFITLISDIKDLEDFNIVLNDFENEQAEKLWPGPNTLIFKTMIGDTKSFRIPKNNFLLSILDETGPLISTSANLHGEPHAKSVTDAQKYFGDEIDFYVDGGELNNPPSNVYLVTNNELVKIR